MIPVSWTGKLRQLAAESKGRRLPSVRELASLWAISTRTVQESVREGISQGWLQTRQGAGVWPKGAVIEPPPRARRLDAVRLAEQIAESIQMGRFASGQILPSPKDQAQQVGLHPATVRKTYKRLESAGLVKREGRSWRIRAPSSKHSSSPPVLVCLGAAGADGNLRMDSDREWEFWREIQGEALRCGLQPRLVAVASALPVLESQTFGVIVSNWHMPDSTRLLDVLQKQRIPTAIWAATEERLPGARYKDAHRLWFHDLAYGRGAGETMGDHLASGGHRKIAWIGPFHASAWSQNRLEGLKDRLGIGVELFEAVHDWSSEWDVQAHLAWRPDVVQRVDLAGVDSGADPDALRRPLVEALTRQHCLEIFGPRLEDALGCGATIWVTASDLVAQWCLTWLRERGVRVPEDLALASFDDTREAVRQNLTSLRFDVQSMARAMIRQILSSRHDHKRVTHYAGTVMARGSTAGGVVSASLRGSGPSHR